MIDPDSRHGRELKAAEEFFALARSTPSPFMRSYYQRVAERYLSSEGELRTGHFPGLPAALGCHIAAARAAIPGTGGRGAGLGIRRGHSLDRAGKHYIAAARDAIPGTGGRGAGLGIRRGPRRGGKHHVAAGVEELVCWVAGKKAYPAVGS